MAKLIVRYPNNVIKEVEFNQARYRIGRAEDNDLVLENDEVEDYQAEVETSGGAYTVVDVSQSKNVTVNGKNVERVAITYGDRISLGPVVALFYPSKKEKVTDKTKLALYIGAGAGIIIISIAMIFFFTSRQISSVVSGQITVTGEKPGVEVGVKAPEGGVVENIPEGETPGGTGISRRLIQNQRREEAKVGGEAISEEGGGTKSAESGRGLALFRHRRVTVALPEPDPLSIRRRNAIAVPRGFRRLFFRKTVIPVKMPALVKKGEETVPEQPLKTAGGEPAGGAPGEEPLPVSEAQKGFFSKMLSPILRLFGRGESEQLSVEGVPEAPAVTAPEIAPGLAGEPATGVETPALGTIVRRQEPEKPSEEDIRRIVDPLALIRSMDVSQMKETHFSEQPVYNENEMKKIEEESPFDHVQISSAESINMDILWQYPLIPRETGAIIRTGALGRIDDDRTIDVVFGNKKNELIALSGKNGDEIFSQELAGPFLEPLLVDINKDRLPEVIVTFEDGSITAFTANLEEIWTYSGGQKITSLPVAVDVTGDSIPDFIFETYDMEVVAVDGKTGFEIWRFYDADGELLYSPVGVDLNDDSTTDIVFTAVDGSLFAVDGKTGWGLWKGDILGRPAGPSAAADLDGDGNVDLVNITKTGIMSAYGRKGNLLFTWETGSTYSTGPSIGDIDGDGEKDIVCIDDNGLVRAYTGETRREIWNFQSDDGTSLGRIALADINADGSLDVAFTTFSGAMYVLDGKTGTILGIFNTNAYSFTTPIVYDINRDKREEIITGAYSGEVFALQMADSKRGMFSFKRSSWETVNHDIHNTGFSESYLPLFKKNPWD